MSISWPEFASTSLQTIQFAVPSVTIDEALRSEYCDFWDKEGYFWWSRIMYWEMRYNFTIISKFVGSAKGSNLLAVYKKKKKKVNNNTKIKGKTFTRALSHRWILCAFRYLPNTTIAWTPSSLQKSILLLLYIKLNYTGILNFIKYE